MKKFMMTSAIWMGLSLPAQAQDPLSDLLGALIATADATNLCHAAPKAPEFNFFPCPRGLEILYNQEFATLPKSGGYELSALVEGMTQAISHEDAFFKGDPIVVTSVSPKLGHDLQRRLAADLGYQAAQMGQGLGMLRDGLVGFGNNVPATLDGLIAHYQSAASAASRTELPLIEARLMGARAGLRWLILTQDDADEALVILAGLEAFVESL